MRNLLLLLTTLITFTLYSQNQKYYIIKAYKNGKVIGQKVLKVEVKGQPAKPNVVVKTKTVTRTVTKTVEVPVVKVETKVVEDTKKIDSLNALIGKYETVNKKTDVIKLKDNLGTVTVNDEIMGNQYVGRNYAFDIKAPKPKEVVREVYKHENEIFVGPSISTNFKETVNSMGLGVMFKPKSGKEIYQINSGILVRNGIMEPTPFFQFQWAIKVK